MRWRLSILVAAAFAALPAAALSAPPIGPPISPPILPPSSLVQLVTLHGVLSHYVPAAGGINGSITIRVTSTVPAAQYPAGTMLTVLVTPATVVQMGNAWNGTGDARIANGATGTVKVMVVRSVVMIYPPQPLLPVAEYIGVDQLPAIRPLVAG